MAKRLTQKQAEEKLKEAQGNKIVFIEKYKNSYTKTHFMCTDCDSILYCLPNDLFTKKTSCPYCSNHHKYTADECEAILNELYRGKVKLNKTTYKNTNEPAELSCRDCHYVWNAKPRNLLRFKNPKEGTGCPRCSNKVQLTFQQVRELVQKESNGKYDIIEFTFKDTRTKAIATCIKGHEWWVRPIDIYGKRKRGCPYCNNTYHRTYEEAIKELDLIYGEGAITFPKEEYKNYRSKLHCTCIKNHKWMSSMKVLVQHHGCPMCIKKSMEEPVIKLLKRKHANYTHEKSLKGCNYKNHHVPLRADFFFENAPLVIETDGQQHFNPIHGIKRLKAQQEKDRLKDAYLKEKGKIIIRATSSPIKEWCTERHKTLKELLELLDIGIDENGNVNMNVFIPHDFNR